MMRDLGKAGEEYFSAWCAAAGITANKSVSDMNGWDVFIEIKNDEKKHKLSTIHEGLLEAKIQIKATDNIKRWVNVELSNLKKMATTSLPSFYVLMEFDKESAPKRAYLLHIDADQITTILKRIAEVIAKDSNVKLNKKTMRLNFTEEINPLSPDKMKEMILGHIGESPLSYLDAKREHLEKTGFEDGTHKIEFSIKGDSELRSLIDISLGQKGKVDIEDVHGSQLRFGVTTDNQKLCSDSAVLEMPNVIPDVKGSMTFRDQKTGRSLTFPVDLYRSPFNMWVPEQYRKVRVDAELFEFQLSHYGKTMHLTAHTENLENFEVERAMKLFKLIHMLWQPKSIKITFTFPQLVSSITVNPGKGFADCSYQLSTMEKIVNIKKHFELDQDLYIAPSEIDKNSAKIDQVNFLINGQLNQLTLNFIFNDGAKTEASVDCLHVVYLELGEYVFVELVLLHGEMTETEKGKFCLAPKRKETLYKTAIKKEQVILEDLKQEIIYVAGNHQSSHLLVDLTPYFFKKIDTPSPTSAESEN